MPLKSVPAWIRTTAAELALFAAIGLVMAFLGPFGSIRMPVGDRLGYWLMCMVGGGIVGIAVDALVLTRLQAFWPRLLVVSLFMSPPVAVLVSLVNAWMYGGPLVQPGLAGFWFQVLVVCFAAMTLRQLAWAKASEPPTPAVEGDPLATFRLRLSARRRAASLFAVEAEDHYLRVHTDAGEELIAARFGDALIELAAAPGFRTHRSWWVAADAIEAIRWTRGRGEARLKCGLKVPVSRSQAGPLKAAGWF